MRRFHSYGPVDCQEHFCVARSELVERCRDLLVGNPEKGGHFFTVWAPRQTGKTWLIHRAKTNIEKRYPDRFDIGAMSMQGIFLTDQEPPQAFLSRIPLLFNRFLKKKVDKPDNWESLGEYFSKSSGVFEKPLVLFIDEFDKLPAGVIDRLVGLFREMYLDRDNFVVHGLALVGVRGVLGVDSERGSPFNVQRSLHVPNFTMEEVEDLFRQYRKESAQEVYPDVIRSVYEATRGQPGLVGWFGELLTEKYNPGKDKPVDMEVWEDTFRLSLSVEWNNTVMNLLAKARADHLDRIVELFTRSDVLFAIDSEWCSYAYLHGIVDAETITNPQGIKKEVCRFSNPFIQRRLYNGLVLDLFGDRTPIPALATDDKLEGVFDKPRIDLPALMDRYKKYLNRLKAKGVNPWKDQPRRADLHLTEAVGHFHLYAWLKEAVQDVCVVSPEFPTGNGKVDLHLRCSGMSGIIEVKSFVSLIRTEIAKKQAADYANQLGLDAICIALFVPVLDEAELEKLSGETVVDCVKVFVSAIGWT